MPKIDSQPGHNLMDVSPNTQAAIKITTSALKNGQKITVNHLNNNRFQVNIGSQSFVANDQEAAAIIGTIELGKKP